MNDLLCPICKRELIVGERVADCALRHSFDRAKEGYFYLLPPNAKSSKAPGDGKDMVLARKRLLETGCYLPLADRLAAEINVAFKAPISLLDAGVGTGYYLQRIAAARGNDDALYGIDISKEAARVAARNVKSAFIAVASVYDLPLRDGCLDAIISVFSPFAEREYARTLRVGGTLIVVAPAEGHLYELRRALYDEVRPVASDLAATTLRPLAKERLSYKFNLDGADDISSLLKMTPYAYRAPQDRIRAVERMEHMELTADFDIYTFVKQV